MAIKSPNCLHKLSEFGPW